MKKVVLPKEYKYIAAFLTMRCNLNCSFCLNAFNKRFDRKGFQEVPGEEWVRGLNRLESRSEIPVTLCGGEPFIHKDFIYIIKNLKKDLKIDILTNLQWGKKGIERFIEEINPARLKRDAPYASIRASYHPEQMGNGEELVKNVRKMQDAGFYIGVWAVQHPSPKNLEAITQMQFRCRDAGIDFRLKDFTGKFEGKDDLGRDFSIIYGDCSKYPNSCFQEKTRHCQCKTSELLIAPNMEIYRCHRDLFVEENSIGSLRVPWPIPVNQFRYCNKYGECHPCDVKLKTNYKQKLGHTSVGIKEIMI